MKAIMWGLLLLHLQYLREIQNRKDVLIWKSSYTG